MSPRPNVATSEMVAGKEPAIEPADDSGADAYPMLSDAQEAALDRDGDDKPGGAPAGGNKPKVGEVVRKGAAPPEETHKRLANEPVTVRVTKSGHGKVHDGQGGFYNWNDETVLPYGVAVAQEGNTFVEIIG